MSNRLPAAVYWRRRAVAAVVVLLPVALLLRTCAGGDAPVHTPSPSVNTSAVAETITAAKSSRTPKPETTTTKPKSTVTATPSQTIADCANSDIEVSITADAVSYQIGSPVTLAMRISNTGKAACKRDIGALSNEVYITDADGAVVWSSDACQTDNRTQVVTMRPGAVFGNTQVWGGLNSGRDCSSAAPDAVPGSYLAFARNDSVVSKGFAFTIQ